MTGEKLPNEEKANKAINDGQFKSSPFNGDVAGLDTAKKELNPPKFKFNYLTETQISLAVSKGEDLSKEQVDYLRDKVDFNMYFAKAFNIPNPTPSKVVSMVADSGVWVMKDDDIKKAFDYKMRDGENIPKGSEKFSRQEEFFITKEIGKYYSTGKTGKTVSSLLDYMYNSTFGIENKPSPELISAREKLAANVQENYERIMNSKDKGEERTGGMKR